MVSSAPTINERIGLKGSTVGLRYTGEDLFRRRRARGALPANIRVLEERNAGASLGNDSIHKGITASLIGFGLVVLGMLVYYRRSGINAVITLVANLILLLGFMGKVGGTRSVRHRGDHPDHWDGGGRQHPDIRAHTRRAPHRKARVPRSRRGFSKVFWTIFDTNTTTLHSGRFPVPVRHRADRGFAVTLTVAHRERFYRRGTLRLFELVLGNRKVEELSI